MLNKKEVEVLDMEIKHELLRTLYKLGLSQAMPEYRYFYEAVMVGIENPDIWTEPLKVGLYRLVAERCLVTENTVSKALSKAKKYIWKNGNDDALLSYFGFTADECDAPATDVFIAAIADSILVSQSVEKSHDSNTLINKTKLIELIEKKLNAVLVFHCL